MAIGFAGVLVLVWNQIAPSHETSGALPVQGLLAAAAALLASALYGVASNFAKKYLMDVEPMSNAAGPACAMTVTFVIPLFGIIWGVRCSCMSMCPLVMLEGCAIVLLGTAIATGALKRLPFPDAESSRRELRLQTLTDARRGVASVKLFGCALQFA